MSPVNQNDTLDQLKEVETRLQEAHLRKSELQEKRRFNLSCHLQKVREVHTELRLKNSHSLPYFSVAEESRFRQLESIVKRDNLLQKRLNEKEKDRIYRIQAKKGIPSANKIDLPLDPLFSESKSPAKDELPLVPEQKTTTNPQAWE